jgi:hypothetical protein
VVKQIRGKRENVVQRDGAKRPVRRIRR